MKNDIRNWQETETETERTVTYDTDKAHIIVHIPKRTPEQQAEYEKNMRAGLRRFYHHVVVERGYMMFPIRLRMTNAFHLTKRMY